MVAKREDTTVDQVLQQKVLLAQQEIERAIAQLAHRKSVFESVCEYIQKSLGFDFVAISLISSETKTIETVCGTGIAAKWSNQCRHYLEANSQIRDIQADIVLTGNTEIIRGEDARFDPWIYKRYEHRNLIRIFTPILLVKDKYGQVCNDWFYPSLLNVVSNTTDESSSKIILSTKKPTNIHSIQVIGTLEAGYLTENIQTDNILANSTISLEIAEKFVAIVASKTKEIYYPLLSHALDVIADNVCNVIGANAVNIKLFKHYRDWQSLIHETSVGYIEESKYGIDLAAEKKYLGERVLRKDEPHIKCYHSHLSQVTDPLTIAVFPCNFNQIQGLIFIECVGKSTLLDQQNGWLIIYLQNIVHSIWSAKTYAQQNIQTSQWTNLHGFTESLTQVSEANELFSQIAWETLHILAADIVVIYEYDQKSRLFTYPDIAGKLIHPYQLKTEVHPEHVPRKLVKHGENIYTSDLENNPVFQDSGFSQREQIQSTAGILLKIGDEILGVMFINYRREHYFLETQQKLIETLASSAAIAIKNQRWLVSWVEALNDIDLKILTTSENDELLNQIVERASLATNANFAAIRIVDKGNQTLETCAIYPPACVRVSGHTLSGFDEGITGWVAKNRIPQRVDDVRQDSRYRAIFPDIGSELCVPLIDKNGHLLGVLNVESHVTKAFNSRDLKMLQMVGGLAVIGIQNLKTQKRLTRVERMATLGDFAAPLVHRINNKVGAIRVLAKDILDDQKLERKFRANMQRILHNAEIALKEAKFIQNWKAKPQDYQWINIREIFTSLIPRHPIPAQIIYNVDIPAKLPQVNCVKIQLSEAFDVLIQNAIDAMPDGGELTISARSIEGDFGCWLEVKVKDMGIGIEPENLERIFEPGFTSKGEGNGHMGFALWWLQSYVEGLGGELNVQSAVGVGSEFKVILPAKRLQV